MLKESKRSRRKLTEQTGGNEKSKILDKKFIRAFQDTPQNMNISFSSALPIYGCFWHVGKCLLKYCR